MDVVVSPTIIENSVEVVEKKLGVLKSLGELCDRVHLDVVDGLFADNITVLPGDFEKDDFSGLDLDVHLMVDDPVEWVEECVGVGVKRVVGQIERMGSQESFVKWVRGFDVSPGLAIDVDTPVGSIDDGVLDDVGVVLLMGYKAGVGGNKFVDDVVDKVSLVRKMFGGCIVVDGGVNVEVCRRVVDAGADEVAVGTYLWEGDVKKRIMEFYG